MLELIWSSIEFMGLVAGVIISVLIAASVGFLLMGYVIWLLNILFGGT